jgi:hypothetical protein
MVQRRQGLVTGPGARSKIGCICGFGAKCGGGQAGGFLLRTLVSQLLPLEAFVWHIQAYHRYRQEVLLGPRGVRNQQVSVPQYKSKVIDTHLTAVLPCRDPDAHTYSMQIVFKAPKEQLQPPVLLPPPPPVLPGPPPLGSMQHMPPGKTLSRKEWGRDEKNRNIYRNEMPISTYQSSCLLLRKACYHAADYLYVMGSMQHMPPGETSYSSCLLYIK